ncbi:hypothetical protein BKM31_22215 [[Actinomadura] parvosata subsp. kistnae]|uniref:Uncharacterized protein n=1 Tax=[Actinomadura] parvosata subsp. kistnae TaxID=1909395 RepID=A0A1V0A0S2_9ACTN|nr:hypothetical protein [Nonomuraea sp. ATCC 55076]AQZ63814.1 hypothetical protein BKM31_22215 [Nonomuraea sp. ATCC 55076]
MGRVDDFVENFFDRNFWAAFTAGSLMLGAFPLILLQQAFDQPELWPRVMTGAAIGAGIMTLPTALLLAPPARRLAQGALALLVSVAVLASFATAAPHRHDPVLVPLEGPGQAEWAGTAALIVAWGAAAVLVMGSYAMTRQSRGRKHRAHVKQNDDGIYVAVCSCGWRGKALQDSSAAFDEAGRHANKVDITLRKVSNSPSKNP